MPDPLCQTADKLEQSLRGAAENEQIEEILRHAETCAGCRTVVDRVLHEEDVIVRALRHPSAKDSFSEEPGLRATLDQLSVLQRAPEREASAFVDTLVATQQTSPDFQSLPFKLGEYRLDALLGKGGMGMVFRAVHLRLG